jgi:hypothetical protein
MFKWSPHGTHILNGGTPMEDPLLKWGQHMFKFFNEPTHIQWLHRTHIQGTRILLGGHMLHLSRYRNLYKIIDDGFFYYSMGTNIKYN